MRNLTIYPNADGVIEKKKKNERTQFTDFWDTTRKRKEVNKAVAFENMKRSIVEKVEKAKKLKEMG